MIWRRTVGALRNLTVRLWVCAPRGHLYQNGRCPLCHIKF